MVFRAYITPACDTPVDFGDLEGILNPRFHDELGSSDQRFMHQTLEFLDNQAVPLAVIDGLIKGTPADPKNVPAFQEPDWQVRFHGSYLILPYSRILDPSNTPILQFIKHTREYRGPIQTFGRDCRSAIRPGDRQTIHQVRYEQGIGTPTRKLERLFKRLLQGWEGQRGRAIPHTQVSAYLVEPAIEGISAIMSNYPGPGRIGREIIPLPFYMRDTTGREDHDGLAEFQAIAAIEFVRSYKPPQTGRPRLLLNF